MQDPEKKTRRKARHSAQAAESEPLEAEQLDPEADLQPDPEAQQPAPDDASMTDEYDLLGDEGDVPIRIGKKKSARGKKKSDKSRQQKGRRKKQEKLFSEKRFHNRRTLFEIMSATDDESFFRPLTLFGRELGLDLRSAGGMSTGAPRLLVRILHPYLPLSLYRFDSIIKRNLQSGKICEGMI